jgi:hypothetical protein
LVPVGILKVDGSAVSALVGNMAWLAMGHLVLVQAFEMEIDVFWFDEKRDSGKHAWWIRARRQHLPLKKSMNPAVGKVATHSNGVPIVERRCPESGDRIGTSAEDVNGEISPPH